MCVPPCKQAGTVSVLTSSKTGLVRETYLEIRGLLLLVADLPDFMLLLSLGGPLLRSLGLRPEREYKLVKGTIVKKLS